MKKMTILFGFLLSIGAFSQDPFNAIVSVTNFDDGPLEEISVELLNTNGTFKKKGVTGSTGSFNVEMIPGKYIVKLSRNGELLKEAAVEIPELEGNRVYNNVSIQILYEERSVFTLDDLHFDTNSSVIKPDSFHMLDRLAEYLISEQGVKFEIAGHTDSDGADDANLTLSNNRAKAVRDYLIKRGVSSDQLVAKGYGEKEPVADNSTTEGKAKNRRTEIRRL
ncbi:MAG: OmpA family protein [Crocinitomicaceae bacterium]|nr:OmpA family protein [Crocinitomicaceae bacterium]